MKKTLMLTALFACGMAHAQSNPLDKLVTPVSNFLNNILKQNTPAAPKGQVSSDVTKTIYANAGQTLTLMVNVTAQEVTVADVVPDGWEVKIDNRMGTNTLLTFKLPDTAKEGDYACTNSPAKVGLKEFSRRLCVFYSAKEVKHEGVEQVKF